jgi:hypothetical protein
MEGKLRRCPCRSRVNVLRIHKGVDRFVVCGGFVHVSITFFDHYFLKIFAKISWAVNSCFCYFIGRKVKPIEIRNARSTYVIFQNTCARIKRISSNFRKDRSIQFLCTSNLGMLIKINAEFIRRSTCRKHS